ncbi:MAG: prepilin-type N-terminal cleavage/methylation domain-containing protein [Planctomycetota bacterium]|jgi:prepilin-type N-terminal cleavage/methylation domain-containing protein
MRRGHSLVELLVALAIISIVSIVVSKLFITLISDIPRSYRIVQENTSVLDMLEQMHEDVDLAGGLPESFAEYTTDKDLLLIELPDGIVGYQLKDGRVLRRSLPTAQEHYEEDTRVWLVPNAKIEWQVLRNDRAGYAVEVKTHIEHNVRGLAEEKMAASHLYFVGAFRKVME